METTIALVDKPRYGTIIAALIVLHKKSKLKMKQHNHITLGLHYYLSLYIKKLSISFTVIVACNIFYC